MDYQGNLRMLKPEHDFFIGIDSDGCVFDTMEVKQKKYFIPHALTDFDLNEISDVLIETWEFVNLYSVHRGGNRFLSLIKVFELLAERKEVKTSGCTLPDLASLQNWIRNETRLSNASLRSYFESNPDPALEKIIRWSENINLEIQETLKALPPFPHAKSAIEEISSFADIMIVSQTPLEALNHEWGATDLLRFVRAVAGQEHGTKTEHLTLAAKGKYRNRNIMMIGDAIGDMEAAKKNGIFFYPIIPGQEDKSWEKLINEDLVKFITGNFNLNDEKSLIQNFRESLPSIPPWIEKE